MATGPQARSSWLAVTVDNLTERAKQTFSAELPALVPEYGHIHSQMAKTLLRQQTKHLLLVGEKGVGKRTVLAEFIRLAATEFQLLQNDTFYHVDCRYCPPDCAMAWLESVMQFCSGHSGPIVCISSLATLLDGIGGRRSLNYLFSWLSTTDVRLIGLLTPSEHRRLFVDNDAVDDLFVTLEIQEPPLDVAVRILIHQAKTVSRHYGVAIPDSAVEYAARLSDNYIINRRLPEKAFDILTRACEDLAYARASHSVDRDQLSVSDIRTVVAELTGVPISTLAGLPDDAGFESSLSASILGQEHVVTAVAAELAIIKAGLVDRGKPASVMLFLGQTGTGKTEMAKTIARVYSRSRRLRIYTLGNYAEPHSVSGLIGVPPGYVGHDQGGSLINELNADPYGVFLFDEADKAHPDVLQPLLHLFDEGWLVDQRGSKAYADNAIFILTSNVGQRMIGDLIRQGSTPEQVETRMREVLSQVKHAKSNRPVFPPEFLARIRRTLVFSPLSEPAMQGITAKMIRELCDTWQRDRGKIVVVSPGFVERVAQMCHRRNEASNGREGARIVKRVLADNLVTGLQRSMAQSFDTYQKCSRILVDTVGDDPDNCSPLISFEQ